MRLLPLQRGPAGWLDWHPRWRVRGHRAVGRWFWLVDQELTHRRRVWVRVAVFWTWEEACEYVRRESWRVVGR